MNDEENIALIQRVYDAYKRGDLQFILMSLSEDVDWIMEGPAIVPYTGKRKGVAQVKEFFEGLAGTQTDKKLTMEPLMSQGDQVAGLGRYSATVTATGRGFDTPVAHFFTVRGGKICRFVNLADTAAIAEAYRGVAVSAR